MNWKKYFHIKANLNVDFFKNNDILNVVTAVSVMIENLSRSA